MEQNSNKVNSQKENIMQVANVKPVVKLVETSKVINQGLAKKVVNTKEEVANSAALSKSQSFSRFLEANGDCV